MSTISFKKGELYMEETPLRQVAEKFGTPLYCYSASQIEKNYLAYEDAFLKIAARKDFTICYAVKSNSNLAVLRLLQKLGCGADVVSAGELARACVAKIPAQKIVFSGVGKTAQELEMAIKANILQINVESEHELETISALAKKLKKTVAVAIRVNPDVDAKTHKKITTGTKENKFGIDIDLAPTLYRKAKKLPNIKAESIQVHIGSQLTSLAPFKKAYQRVAELVLTLRKQGNTITTVDLGGGIGITYKDETPLDLYRYALMIRDIILPLGVHVIVEPGRSISGNAGVLLAQVIRTKKGTAKKFLIVDAAMNDLIRPTLYDAYHEVLPLRQAKGKKDLYDVVGPVCETGDTFLTNEALPTLKDGDYVAIMTSGAYGATMSSTYNTRPLAGEVLVRGKDVSIIRKPQSLEDLLAQDSIPAWLA